MFSCKNKKKCYFAKLSLFYSYRNLSRLIATYRALSRLIVHAVYISVLFLPENTEKANSYDDKVQETFILEEKRCDNSSSQGSKGKSYALPGKKEIMYNEKIEEKWPVKPNNQSNPNDTDVLT